jgi:chromosome segregation ATPase
MATKFDRETFNLLKMTDSGSESVPDHSFEISHQSRNKKKVRLKRRERKARGSVGVGGKMGKIHEAWWCTTCPASPALLPSSTHLFAFVAALAVIAIVSIGFFTSNLHYKIQILEDQLRSKIVDDDAKSVPESLEQIGSRLRALESNQTSVSGQLARISSSVTKIMTRLDEVNASLAEGGENPLRLSQDVAEIREGVGEVTKQLKIVANRSTGNSEAIAMINKELNTLKLNEIDMKNGREMVTSPKTKNLSNLDKKVKSLDSKVEEQTHQLDSLNMSIFDIERNTSAQLELEHKDVVSLAGKVASLQDDNLNVSSSLASLSVRCSNEITALLTNLTDLNKKIGAVVAVQSRMEASGGEESLVQNKQAMLDQQNDERRSDTDANVEENSDTKKDLDRTELEDKSMKLQDSQKIL